MSSSDSKAAAPAARVPLRRLIALSRPEWPMLGAGTLILLVGSALGLIYPQAVRWVIDGALAYLERGADVTTALASVDRAALWMAIIFALQSGALALRYYLFAIAGERVVTRLRRELFARILDQETAFFDERATGELTSRLSSDTATIESTITTTVSHALRDFVLAAGGIAMLFASSAKLATAMLAVVPAIVLGAVFLGRRIEHLSKEVQDALARSGEVAQESISGIRTVRAFGGESGALARYAHTVARAFELARRRARTMSAFASVAFFAGYGAVSGVLWFGGRLVIARELSVGELASFLLYTLTVALAIGSLGDAWADLLRARGSAARVFELLDRKSAMPLSGGAKPASLDGRVALEHVSFAYPARPNVEVLAGVDLDVRPGEAVALVGPSGSGKSTIAALIGRFYDVTRGVVRIDGRDVRELDPTWLRSHMGVVAQEPTLFSTSIEENIRYGRLDASTAEIEAAARAANAHDFVAAFPEGYATQVGERGVKLSVGQKQRIAIARAVLRDPRILILDEATSALDAESEHLVQEALERLMKGRTTFVIAHRLSTVVGADRVVVIESGSIVQVGRHEDLLRDEDGTYRRLVQRQLLRA